MQRRPSGGGGDGGGGGGGGWSSSPTTWRAREAPARPQAFHLGLFFSLRKINS
ncbi:unnamed protein product [Spirodela intermedia]|uniref:Uncharacterized protein n=1 Tax=Spirodela intermedia TaxID=51605 RepID=A0A7I8J1B7_SPIIN|nr:unnamed protein product [Spirodela intermedia]CAA6663603.1 unnamed protein product [Spirodela intermedia]